MNLVAVCWYLWFLQVSAFDNLKCKVLIMDLFLNNPAYTQMERESESFECVSVIIKS